MGRPVGLPKSGGRIKGTPNNKTLILQEIFEELGADIPRMLIKLLPHLDSAKQADVLLELLSFLYPKRKALEHLVSTSPESTIEASIATLSQEEQARRVRNMMRRLAVAYPEDD